ncbi:SEL1-like repeat protein [Candidatus Francisella endociliophora]|uniref:SEL1-like repeat protein n=1 Tax=Candidatus Francisella endociliophora TaxID=653937 RepID=UPI0006950BA6|nr:SEL1-like repeat protein [Francisella sp. FSC1006]
MKKTLLITSLLAISTYSFADMKDCALASANQNDKDIVEYCTPYLKDKNNPEATAILSSYEAREKNYKKTLDYATWIVTFYEDKSSLNSNEENIYTGSITAIGNIYYFGQAGKADKVKGLEYITKAANLGNDFAENQLGDFYNSNDKFPGLNVAKSYKWYTLASANGNTQANKSGLMSVIDTVTKQAPYCIAMGEQLVAQAYIDGSAGLSKDTSKAKKYLNDAIALYKDNEPTKENLQYCPEGADKLNLDSAKKQLDSL